MKTLLLYMVMVMISFEIIIDSAQAVEVPRDYYNAEENLNLAHQEFIKGNYTEVVFALQRVQAIQPSNISAGLLLARTYAKLKEYNEAKDQYEKILPLLPKSERLKSQKELAQMLFEKNLSSSALVGLDFGYDDNLSSLTASDSVFIPARNQEFIFNDNKIEEGAVLRLFGAGNLMYQIDNNQWWRLDGLLSQRLDGTYNQRQVYAAVSYYRRIEDVRYNVKFDNSFLNGDDLDRRVYSNLSIGRNKALAKGSWNSELKLSQRHYTDQNIRNDRRATVSIEYKRLFANDWLAEIEFNVSKDLQSRGDRKDLDYNSKGVSFEITKPINKQLKFTFGGDYQHYRYQDEDISFLRQREDERIRLKTGLRYAFDSQTSFGARLEWLQNESNIVLNEYDKKIITFSYIYKFD